MEAADVSAEERSQCETVVHWWRRVEVKNRSTRRGGRPSVVEYSDPNKVNRQSKA